MRRKSVADVATAPIPAGDLPEQAQWELENGRSITVRLEVWLNDVVGRNQRCIWWLTILTAVLPLLLHAAIDAPYLFQHVTPYLPLTLGGLFAIVTLLFLINSFMDPGTVQPYLYKDLMRLEQQLQFREGSEYEKDALISTSDDSKMPVTIRRQTQWMVNGQEVVSSFCYHCRIYQPPRVHHCQLCAKCVERFDHHCPWLDNCVGLRNYPWFILMLILHGVLWLLWITSTLIHIIMRCMQHWRAIAFMPASLFQIAVGLANLHFLSILLSCQRDLLKLGLTVHEFKTDKYYSHSLHRFRSPFDKGSFWRNVTEAFWKPWRPISYLPNMDVPTTPAREEPPPRRSVPSVSDGTIKELGGKLGSVAIGSTAHADGKEEKKGHGSHLVVNMQPFEGGKGAIT